MAAIESNSGDSYYLVKKDVKGDLSSIGGALDLKAPKKMPWPDFRNPDSSASDDEDERPPELRRRERIFLIKNKDKLFKADGTQNKEVFDQWLQVQVTYQLERMKHLTDLGGQIYKDGEGNIKTQLIGNEWMDVPLRYLGTDADGDIIVEPTDPERFEKLNQAEQRKKKPSGGEEKVKEDGPEASDNANKLKTGKRDEDFEGMDSKDILSEVEQQRLHQVQWQLYKTTGWKTGSPPSDTNPAEDSRPPVLWRDRSEEDRQLVLKSWQVPKVTDPVFGHNNPHHPKFDANSKLGRAVLHTPAGAAAAKAAAASGQPPRWSEPQREERVQQERDLQQAATFLFQNSNDSEDDTVNAVCGFCFKAFSQCKCKGDHPIGSASSSSSAPTRRTEQPKEKRTQGDPPSRAYQPSDQVFKGIFQRRAKPPKKQ